ncbi:MAG: endonuclease III [Negativicutes bacterium]|nr:endonuclease III [Negativicutes bacterium]MBP8629746.1 endonuclease III [Negativicutes bacterium]MBP9537573.1 endonuclease III [Negativicutes bacterium]MBP9949035.1 endonuclease III [Negativicutes bacterium]
MYVTKKIKHEMLQILEDIYIDSKPALKYNSEFELLIAVILSAQCTDVRVNITTGRMFPRYNTPEKMLQLTVSELEEQIKDCGLYKSKAKNIHETCKILSSQYNSVVPSDFDELIKLPGVGRKTANVVRSILFDIPAIAVDTHVFRVSNRLRLAQGLTPLEVEKKLMKAIPQDKWSAAHHWLIWHGRLICKARKPLCHSCKLAELCPSSGK